MTESFRLENDSMGSIEVPNTALWGAQTQRALINFAIGKDKVPIKLIYALVRIKSAAAKSNHRLGVLSKRKAEFIINACNEVTSGIFPKDRLIFLTF